MPSLSHAGTVYVCAKCLETKPESEFYRTRHGTVERKCKRCRAKQARENRGARQNMVHTVSTAETAAVSAEVNRIMQLWKTTK